MHLQRQRFVRRGGTATALVALICRAVASPYGTKRDAGRAPLPPPGRVRLASGLRSVRLSSVSLGNGTGAGVESGSMQPEGRVSARV